METPWTKTDQLKVGLHPPEQCARGRTDCRSLAQVISTEEPRTFICCGEVAPGCTPEPQDQWSFCMGCDRDGDRPGGTNLRIFIDRVDMSDMTAVLATGLSMTVSRERLWADRRLDHELYVMRQGNVSNERKAVRLQGMRREHDGMYGSGR